MGFNNQGLEPFAARLALRGPGVVGANIGANKDAADRIGDYVTGLTRLWGLARYFTINISSPNTPGLRALQGKAALTELIAATRKGLAQSDASTPPPLLLKIAPDLTEQDLADIAEVALEGKLAGIIATNTTIDYALVPGAKDFGGISGRALKEKSFQVFEEVARALFGKTVLVSVGGIDCLVEAYRRLKAGASLVQLYTALIYQGPGVQRVARNDMNRPPHRDGFARLDEAVGRVRRPWPMRTLTQISP